MPRATFRLFMLIDELFSISHLKKRERFNKM